MRTTTFERVIADTGALEFVTFGSRNTILNEDEYFAVMVTDISNPDSPHVKGIDVINHLPLVGIEKTTRQDGSGYYISKDYSRRKTSSRGQSVVVKVKDIDKCCLLSL
jgi:hypothetical protein